MLSTQSRFFVASVMLALAACSGGTEASDQTLAEARAGRDAGLTEQLQDSTPAPTPPAGVLDVVHYPAEPGEMVGYLTPDPGDGKKHPAIVWISGGDQTIGDFWSPQPQDNDQSAAIFREKGIVTFYPAVRGLNGNPGSIEGFYGETNDVVAATKWLKQQPWVDPERVYLGGHSTGGTLALLSSEYAHEWAGVFSFGPVDDIQYYDGSIPINVASDDEEGRRLRSPLFWLSSIQQPTFVIEGDVLDGGNVQALQAMEQANSNDMVHFLYGGGCDHFNVLRAGSEIIADAILADKTAELANDPRFASLCR